MIARIRPAYNCIQCTGDNFDDVRKFCGPALHKTCGGGPEFYAIKCADCDSRDEYDDRVVGRGDWIVKIVTAKGRYIFDVYTNSEFCNRFGVDPVSGKLLSNLKADM